jgi:hypothetical protein
VAERSPDTDRVDDDIAVDVRVPVMNAVEADSTPATAAELAPM